VAQPGGARRQITFSGEPVAGGLYEPGAGRFLVFSQDTGGGEFYQLYRLDLVDGRVTLLTDGKSRNGNAHFSRDGRWLFFNSTRRNGRDTDLWRMDPRKPDSARMILQVEGGGWGVLDVQADGSRVLLQSRRSINDSDLHLVDAGTGTISRLSPEARRAVSFGAARFTRDGRSVICTTDWESEFQRLARIDIAARTLTVLTPDLKWDIESFDLSPDGKSVAFATNEDGISRLQFLTLRTSGVKAGPALPAGVLTGLEWHESGRDIGFSLAHAQSPTDAYSVDVKSNRLTRWTESETGGLNPRDFREPELVRSKSFDGLTVSAFVHRPDPAKFPGKRPALVIIHGGPESQARPGFQARYNYFLNELGIALVIPNVRGSAGYGKTFLTLDDGFKREDSVKDLSLIHI
jgi:dipeptidyl aminopeptidase/acylaminoacyl peptidase